MRRYGFLFLVISILLTGCSSSDESSSSQLDSSSSSQSSNSQVVQEPDTSWIPEGFNSWDENIAWRWVDRSSDCSDCTYWHIQVISNFGCPNGVYAEINIEKNSEVVDWTNDTIAYLGPAQKGVLAFEKYGLSGSPSSYQGSLTKLNCR